MTIEEELIRRLSVLERKVNRLVMPEIGGWHLIPNCDVLLTGSQASITLPTTGTLPQIYRHLMVFSLVRTDAVATIDTLAARFNGDAAAHYDTAYLLGTGAGVISSTSATAQNQISWFGWTEAANSRASCFGLSKALIPDYANTAREKMCRAHTSIFGDLVAANIYVLESSGHWQSTAAITSILLFPLAGPNFVAGSRFMVYGIF